MNYISYDITLNMETNPNSTVNSISDTELPTFEKPCHVDSLIYHVFSDHIYQPLRSGRIWHKVNF